MISADEFRKIELRVGKVLEAHDVPGARLPLYKLVVDLGELGTRTIASRTKGAYEKSELIGKLVVCVSNLEAKNIAGVDSQGMILAAEHGEAVAVLTPDKEIALGSLIH